MRWWRDFIHELNPISLWFELSYAQYLTIPRSVLEAMPQEWQSRFAECLFELDDTIEWRPEPGRYWCRLRDDKGKFVNDPLGNYRYPPKIKFKAAVEDV